MQFLKSYILHYIYSALQDELSEPPPPEVRTEDQPQQQRGRGRPPKQKPVEQPAAVPVLPQLYDEFEDEIMK